MRPWWQTGPSCAQHRRASICQARFELDKSGVGVSRRIYSHEMSTLTLTNEAVSRLKSVLQTQDAPDGALRVFITPGGCSGFSYGMSLEAEPAEDDEIVEQGGVKVVVDPFSLQYLEGAQIDFIDSLMGGGFTVVNPNAVKSCACGQSFDTTFGGGAAKPCH